MKIDASCGERTVPGRFLGKLFYRTKLLDVLIPRKEYTGSPNNGGEHTLRLYMEEGDVRAFLSLIEECCAETPGCREFVQYVVGKLPTDRVVIHSNEADQREIQNPNPAFQG